MAGKFFWYDVMTTDIDAAKKFYEHVVGWITEDSGQPGQDYRLFTVEGRGVAGLMRIPEDARKAGVGSAWMGYIAVDDVDQAAAQLAQKGGTIHRAPMEIPGVIRLAVVADPQGAGFLIAKGLVKDPPPALPEGTIGTVGWHELYASDGRTAFAFYRDLFGWSESGAVDMGSMGTYQMFATGHAAVGGIMTKPEGVPMPYWGYYFNVAGIDAAKARVSDAGGTTINGPHQVPGGQWIIQCRDPQGAVFALVSAQQ